MTDAVMLPTTPTEAMIRAACLNQCDEKYASYEEWCDSHTSGIVERIRNYLIADYKAMVSAYIKEPS